MADQYWIVGPDGREFGPVPIETVARWIEEGRVVPSSRVRVNDGEPAEAHAVPELMRLFPTDPFAAPAGAPPLPGAAAIPTEFRAWGFIEHAWGIVKEDWLPFAAMIFIMTAISLVPKVGWVVSFFIQGAIMIGIWRAVLGRIDGRKPTVGMMFEGFDRFLDAFVGALVIGVVCTIGYVFLIVPGIILTIMWIFTFPVLAETKLNFWQAMDASVSLTKGYRMELFLLGLACLLIILLGLLCCCVGVFVAQPVCLVAFGLAYRFLQARQRAVTAVAVP